MEIIAFDIDELREIMKENKIKSLIDTDNGGHKTLTNFGGMQVLINKTGESVFYQRYNGEIKESEIFYDGDSAYFKSGSDKFLLSEFLRNSCSVFRPYQKNITV